MGVGKVSSKPITSTRSYQCIEDRYPGLQVVAPTPISHADPFMTSSWRLPPLMRLMFGMVHPLTSQDIEGSRAGAVFEKPVKLMLSIE